MPTVGCGTGHFVDPERRARLVRRLTNELAEDPQCTRDVVPPELEARSMLGQQRVQSEIESCHDAEIAAPAPNCPEEILVPPRPKFQHITVGRHELCTDHVIARRPEQPSR